MVRNLSAILCTALLFFGVGCSEQAPPPKQTPVAPMQGVEHAPVPQVLKIVVPETVAGMWKSVRIAVHDQQTDLEDVYTVDIGGSFFLPAERLQVTIETFLPAFVADGRQITSVSNQTTNPAARIILQEQDKVVYHGWLFSLYPDAHAYQHQRYNFTLIGYQPAG